MNGKACFAAGFAFCLVVVSICSLGYVAHHCYRGIDNLATRQIEVKNGLEYKCESLERRINVLERNVFK